VQGSKVNFGLVIDKSSPSLLFTRIRVLARLRSSLSSLADWQRQYAVGSHPRRSSGGHDAGGSGQRAAGALMNINESRTRLH